jgi:xanthine dehydrogenase molybdopterin-binding subunit B
MKIAGIPLPHESADGHVTGSALYTDDLVGRLSSSLHVWPVMAHSFIGNFDLAKFEQETQGAAA